MFSATLIILIAGCHGCRSHFSQTWTRVTTTTASGYANLMVTTENENREALGDFQANAPADISPPPQSGGAPAFRAAAAKTPLVRATGVGYPPPNKKGAQARLMARRAAEVVAVRNLKTELERKGHRFGSFRYKTTEYRTDGSVEVTVESAPPIR